MKLGFGIVVVVSALASSAHAELRKLGDFALTDHVKKVRSAKATVLGCGGSVRHALDGDKVGSVVFTADRCDAAALAAAIQKEYAGKPITSVDGKTRLWEGKATSILLTADVMGTTVRLVPPGPGSKRTCFADDGFAGFFQTFKSAFAAGNAKAVAATFKFPIRDFDDKVVVKDAATFVKRFAKLFDAADRKSAGDLEPTCDVALETYEISLSDSYVALEAHKIRGRWQWVEMNAESTD